MMTPIFERCPLGTQYDAANRVCDASADCIEIECTSASPNLQSYAFNSPYFIACEQNLMTGDISQYVLKCPSGLVFDTAEADCILPVITTTTEITKTTSTLSTPGPNDFRCFTNGLVPGTWQFILNKEIKYIIVLFHFDRSPRL
jgi:hypothetical protein